MFVKLPALGGEGTGNHMATEMTIKQNETRKYKRVSGALSGRLHWKKSTIGQRQLGKITVNATNGRAKSPKTYKSNALSPRQILRLQRNIRQVKQALSGIVKNSEIERWLSAPNPLLNGSRPVDSIKLGKTKQVLDMVAFVQEGIHV